MITVARIMFLARYRVPHALLTLQYDWQDGCMPDLQYYKDLVQSCTK